jgi:hypothetical protein
MERYKIFQRVADRQTNSPRTKKSLRERNQNVSHQAIKKYISRQKFKILSLEVCPTDILESK